MMINKHVWMASCGQVMEQATEPSSSSASVVAMTMTSPLQEDAANVNNVQMVTVDISDYVVVEILKDGSNNSHSLQQGPNGFAVATLSSGDTYETDVPNLTIVSSICKKPAVMMKRPASAKYTTESSDEGESAEKEDDADVRSDVTRYYESGDEGKDGEIMKKPSAVVSPIEEVAEPVCEGALCEAPLRTYRKEWYKNHHTFGIRQKFGARSQVFSIGGKKANLSHRKLETIADKIISLLEGGMTESNAKALVPIEIEKAQK